MSHWRVRVALSLSLALAGLAPFRSTLAQATPQSPTVFRRPAAPFSGAIDPTILSGLRYRSIGPARGGRVTAVAGVPSQPFTFYMGSTGGGVWKTVDAGQSWLPITDGQIGVGSMGAIDVSLSDPNTIYIGTGSDGYRSNVSIGDGVYKSTDAGKTWAHIGLRDAGNIGGVRVHPTDANTAFVAAIGNPFKPNVDRGIFRTKDGGKTWQKVLFVSDSTGAVDVEFQPGNPNVLFASMWRAERKPWTIISGAREGGVYRSTNGGDTWTKITNGLPNELVGKSNVAVSDANPNRIYVLMEAKPGNGLYRSDDGGLSFQLASTFPQIITRPFYYVTITADPRNPDVLYSGAEGYFRSPDAGKTWQPIRVPHGDNHDMWINPNNSEIMIQANDGGANVSLNGGRTWSTQYNQPTAEIYQVYVDNQFPYRLYGAQQDNSTLILPSLPTSSSPPDDPIQSWQSGPGCETGPIMPHPTNPDTVYGSCKGQYSRMSLRTGQEKSYWVGGQSLYGNAGKDLIYRFQRVSPMDISPHDPRTVYYGSQYVHRTRDEGVTWERISPDLTANDPKYQGVISGAPITIDVTGEEMYATLYAIRESPRQRGVIWAGANDGPIHVTRDGGKSWRNVTPSDLPPGGRVQTIEPSPHRAGSAYVAVLRYLLGDFRPYAYRTNDYGRTWTRIADGANGIPADEPVRVVREDPERAGLLYAGTEFGMYVSFDDGARWQPLQLALPHVPVTDLKVHRGDLVLSTQGRGFWILDDLSPLRQAADSVKRAAAFLYRPREAVRFRYAGDFGGPEAASARPDAPQYPPYGAAIDYWLATEPASLRVEVLDAAGRVVRAFTSDSAAAAADPAAAGTPLLPRRAGAHRLTWNLALPGAWEAGRGSGRNGPLAVPGAYTVRLTADGRAWTQPLALRADPRAAADGVTQADLEAQFAHNLRVRDLVSEVNRLVARVQEARRRLRSADSPAARDTLARLAALEALLVTPPVRYSRPALQAQIAYLYGLTTQGDQRIGRDAVERYATLRGELDTVQAE